MGISIHALRVEGDTSAKQTIKSSKISIHAFRVEGDRYDRQLCFECLDFYPRPPGGGRRVQALENGQILLFLSTPSGWRATTAISAAIPAIANFYPRPPGGGRLLLFPNR